MATVSVSDENLEYLRKPPAGVENVHGPRGRSPDQTAIIVCRYTREIVPLDHITGLVLDRIRPGHGGTQGYSTHSHLLSRPSHGLHRAR